MMRSHFRLVVSLFILSGLGCDGGPSEPSLAAFEIIYRGQLSPLDGGFMVMKPDGTNRRVLARPSENFFCPSLSPDGTRLLFSTITTNQIATIDLRTAVETRLTPTTVMSQCPAWSPDGTQIAFFPRPRTKRVWPVRDDADGTGLRELAADGYTSNGLDWSPDGKWLAVTRFSFKLVLVDAETGVEGTVLTPTMHAYLADFSPDGSHVVYAVEESTVAVEESTVAEVHLYVSNIDGTNTRRLTPSPGSTRTYHSGPRYSPDGSHVAYWSTVPDTLPGRAVPGVLLISSSNGAAIEWKNGARVFGDQPFWRKVPR